MVNAGDIVNSTEITSGLWQSLEPLLLDKLSPLITIFKAVGIAILIYVVFLIIRALFRWKMVSKIKKISKDVSEINQKLDLLIKKPEAKHKKIKKEKK
tara:strand:+ start:1045 stop:1338 length:294 start_codon:yes stop_codon:yes gene_type:complete